MHAASRAALSAMESWLDGTLGGEDTVAKAARVGGELFDVVDALDGDRQLRVALAETSISAENRAQLIRAVFGEKVSFDTSSVLTEAVRNTWSSAREFREGLVKLGRRALLRGAQAEGLLEKVERELLELSRLLAHEGRLTQLLSDRAVAREKTRGLLADVLYGKVTMTTEALALQAVGRPEKNVIDDIANLAEQAAAVRGCQVARVITAGELSDEQRGSIAEKLERVYGTPISVHSEIDESVLGGAIIRIGDERIDGSLRGRFERLRASIASA